MVRFTLQTKLRSQRARIAVWGTGYIGLATMAYYARRGVRCVGYDISKDVVESINAGKIPFVNLEHWLGFSIEPLVSNGLIHATSHVNEILEDVHTQVHFVAVPTEKNGSPWGGALLNVSKKLSAKKIGG